VAKLKDSFKVIAQSVLSQDDFKVLNLLYLPIIGSDALATYLFLAQLLDKNNYQSTEYKHHFLIDVLNMKIKEFNSVREKLEAINLLSTFNKDNEYIYQLRMPLPPRQFLKDSVLGQFLISEIGEKNYFQLTDFFKVNLIDLTDFKNITKQFDDLYKFEPIKFYDQNDYLERRQNGGIVISNVIDFDKFIELLPNRLKKPSLLNWDTREYIQKLAYVYRFDEEELAGLYEETATNQGSINLKALDMRAQRLYASKLDSDVRIERKASSEEDLRAKYLSESSPMQIVEAYSIPELKAEALDTVFQFVKRNNVDMGLTNALLLHIFKFKEGILPHINYLEKVLSSWLQKGIKNAEDALVLITNFDTDNKNRKTNQGRGKKEDWVPSWVDDYMKELEELEDN